MAKHTQTNQGHHETKGATHATTPKHAGPAHAAAKVPASPATHTKPMSPAPGTERVRTVDPKNDPNNPNALPPNAVSEAPADNPGTVDLNTAPTRQARNGAGDLTDQEIPKKHPPNDANAHRTDRTGRSDPEREGGVTPEDDENLPHNPMPGTPVPPRHHLGEPPDQTSAREEGVKDGE